LIWLARKKAIRWLTIGAPLPADRGQAPGLIPARFGAADAQLPDADSASAQLPDSPVPGFAPPGRIALHWSRHR
jgi:hypothetical protein